MITGDWPSVWGWKVPRWNKTMNGLNRKGAKDAKKDPKILFLPAGNTPAGKKSIILSVLSVFAV